MTSRRKSEEKTVSCLAGCFFMFLFAVCVVTIVFNVSMVVIKVYKNVNPEPAWPVGEKVEPAKPEPECTIDEWIDKYNKR